MDSDNDGGSVDNELVEGASDSSSDAESEASDDGEEDHTEEEFQRDLQMIRDNDPNMKQLTVRGNFIQNITNERWEEIGRDIKNNTILTALELYNGALNDEKISYLFRGLTRSSSIDYLNLSNNDLSIAGVRSMVPFLQHANNLQQLDLDYNNLQSEGFNYLLQSLCDSPIKNLFCDCCTIESIEIDLDHFPRHLTKLSLFGNHINADGCRGLAKLLQGGDSTLTYLNLNENKIDDEGVAILVDALENNTSLKTLVLFGNNGISREGLVMLLKLVNDISSVNATLQSNHTLRHICVIDEYSASSEDFQIKLLVNTATQINAENAYNPEAAGREKVIRTQLDSRVRDAFAELQGVSQSVYSEISPLHLPEVLSLVDHRYGHYGQGELYVALKSSIAGLM